MTMYTLTIEDTPRSEDVQLLAQGLTAHTLPYTQVPGFIPLGVFLKDEHGALVGGVWGQVNWNLIVLKLPSGTMATRTFPTRWGRSKTSSSRR